MRYSFDSWVGKIPWSKKWQLTPVLLPEKLHGQRSLVGYSPRGCKASNTTKRLNMQVFAILSKERKKNSTKSTWRHAFLSFRSFISYVLEWPFSVNRQRFLSWRHSCAQIKRKLMQNKIDISKILSHSEFDCPNSPLTHLCLYIQHNVLFRVVAFWCKQCVFNADSYNILVPLKMLIKLNTVAPARQRAQRDRDTPSSVQSARFSGSRKTAGGG